MSCRHSATRKFMRERRTVADVLGERHAPRKGAARPPRRELKSRMNEDEAKPGRHREGDRFEGAVRIRRGHQADPSEERRKGVVAVPPSVGGVLGEEAGDPHERLDPSEPEAARDLLLRGVGAEIVVIGTLVTEASVWRSSLGEDAAMVRALGSIPIFRPDGQGGLVEDWAG
jgi:hypothetical protein